MNLFISTCLLIFLIDNNKTNGRAIGSINEPRKRIVNGQDAQLFDVPSQVAVMRKFDGIWDRWCGAVLIAWNKVLTAAHCVDDSLPSDLRAVVGFLNYNEPLTGYEQVASISEINVHENDRTILNVNVYDIAVLTLATPVRPSNHVKVAKLADKSESYVNTTCIISGWGYTNKTLMTQPNGLQKAVTMIISNTECKMEWPQFADALDEELFLCVYNEKDQPTSICAGDSGGPLLCGPNNDILVGTAVSNEGKCKDVTSKKKMITSYASCIQSCILTNDLNSAKSLVFLADSANPFHALIGKKDEGIDLPNLDFCDSTVLVTLCKTV